jgi:hypothetical protein
VSEKAAPATPGHGHALGRDRIVWFASIAFCGVLPALTVAALFVDAIHDDAVAFDFRPFYRAAGSILGGTTPYPDEGVRLTAESGAYVYPPLGGLLATPLHPLPLEAAGLTVMALLVVAAAAVPFVLGVRDWRCYGLLFLWPPVLSAIQTGNVTLWFALAAALAWRFRDRVLPVAVSIGATLAAKFFLWPLVVWLAATRRIATALLACALGAALLLASWAVIGFAGMLDYPALLRKLEETVGDDSYTAYIVALDMGLPSGVARALWLAIGVGLLAWVVLLGRRGDERSAFIAAIAASLALTPIVWLHYFALLLVVVAVAQPRLSLVWFCPLALIVTPGSGHPTPFQTAWTLGTVAVVVALSSRTSMAWVSRAESERDQLVEARAP